MGLTILDQQNQTACLSINIEDILSPNDQYDDKIIHIGNVQWRVSNLRLLFSDKLPSFWSNNNNFADIFKLINNNITSKINWSSSSSLPSNFYLLQWALWKLVEEKHKDNNGIENILNTIVSDSKTQETVILDLILALFGDIATVGELIQKFQDILLDTTTSNQIPEKIATTLNS